MVVWDGVAGEEVEKEAEAKLQLEAEYHRLLPQDCSLNCILVCVGVSVCRCVGGVYA